MAFESGSRVVLHGLVSAAALNGRDGIVRGPADPKTGRYQVVLPPKSNAPEKGLKVKPTNLCMIELVDQLVLAAHTGDTELLGALLDANAHIIDTVQSSSPPTDRN